MRQHESVVSNLELVVLVARKSIKVSYSGAVTVVQVKLATNSDYMKAVCVGYTSGSSVK